MTAPVIHVQPSTQTVYEGQTCKFRVVAGGAGLSYQWQKSDDSGSNWNSVSGATSPSYTTAATVRSTDNGDQYRCVVSGSGGSTTSNAATMTVWNPSALGSNFVWLNPSTCFTERTGSSATTACAEGDPVGTLRDSTATINGIAPADAQRPTYRATGLNGQPCIQFTRSSTTLLNFTTDLASFFNAKSYGYIFAGVRTVAENFDGFVFGFTNTSTGTRAAIQLNAAGLSTRGLAAGRRLDADSYQSTTSTTAFIDDEVMVVGGEFLWGVSDLHFRRNKTRLVSNTSWQTSGSTSATNSAHVCMGASTTAGASPASVYIGHVVLCNPLAELSSDTIALIEGFIEYKSGLPTIDWNLNTRSAGVMSTATVKATTVIQSPSGATVTESDLPSWRYRHSNQIWYHWGRLHVAYDASGTNEHGGGGNSHYQYSDDLGLTWSAPQVLVPSQSNWTAAATAFAAGSHVIWSRRWVTYQGRLFYTGVVALLEGSVLNDEGSTAVMIAAVEVFENGTVGTPFRITPEDYSTVDGKTKLNYDSTLGPALFPTASIFGRHGGTASGRSGAAMDGFQTQDGEQWFEKHAAYLNDTDSDRIIRTLRKLTTSVSLAFFSESSDGGNTWSYIRKTNVPTSPSPTELIRLHNGKFAIIGNIDSPRTELYLAILNATTRRVESLNYIRTGVSSTPDYAGTFKTGGAAYAAAVQVGNYLHVSYSTQKEDMVHSRVLIPGLSDNGNDSDSIDVTSPALDDTRTVDTAANITGTQSGTSGNVDILLSLDGGFSFPITLASNTTLPYSWTPTYGHISSTCVLRVSDTADTNVFGDSLQFQVQDAASSGGAANLLLMGVG